MRIQVTLFIYIYFASVAGLKNVRVQTPTAVIKGENIRLYCLYDTENELLYIVKWYKAGREFYRYVPQERPAARSFPFGGLKIKESESNATQVTLLNVTNEVAGSYSCEVSADAPSFQTATVTRSVDVVELPSERPVITGMRKKDYSLKNRIRANDILRLNCSTLNSRPAANLTWFINNKQVPEDFVRNPMKKKPYPDDVNISSLHYPVTPDSFINGKMKIRCSASIYDIYWQSTEVSVEEEKERKIDIELTNDIFGINYHPPPPNYQLGQRILDGEIDIHVIGTASAHNCVHYLSPQGVQLLASLIYIAVSILD